MSLDLRKDRAVVTSRRDTVDESSDEDRPLHLGLLEELDPLISRTRGKEADDSDIRSEDPSRRASSSKRRRPLADPLSPPRTRSRLVADSPIEYAE